ncbi:MAG: glycosyltransferase [Alphaproteobacteria bacterium]|nr:glycosyltransferase [Alphaproteobacteria bacterium]MBF0395005.1 glycosyltransferase [Alphaproteobacteria bacterium]
MPFRRPAVMLRAMNAAAETRADPRPAFAVSLPVYGYAECVAEALTSLAVQDWPVRAALLDATPDQSVQVASRGFEDLLAWGYHHADGGQSAAINAGWRNLPGEILAWLNADDLLFPDTLPLVGALFAAHPEIDVVWGHAVHVTFDGRFVEYFPAVSSRPEDLRRGCTIAQPSCFVRRRAIEKAGFLDEARHYTMDWDLWCRLLESGARFRFLDRPLSLVRLHGDSKTASGASRRFAEIAEIARRQAGPLAGRLVEWRFRAGHLAEGSALLRLIRGATRALRPARRLFGIDAWTNRVQDSCVLHLAWLRPAPPIRLMLRADRPGAYRATVAGRLVEGVAEADGAVGFALPPLPVPGRIEIGLARADGTAWRLSSAWLEGG